MSKPRKPSRTRQCGHPRCVRRVGHNTFACATHWEQVPLGLRMSANDAARRGPKEHTAALRAIEYHWLKELGG